MRASVALGAGVLISNIFRACYFILKNNFLLITSCNPDFDYGDVFKKPKSRSALKNTLLKHRYGGLYSAAQLENGLNKNTVNFTMEAYKK